ncbi:hypothetical protein ACYFX5_03705 [Bremerella sp. T1]|uniref:hypothetical protein n=1 Tax=Bremerella sp. TYQ1 TaxID=3119568 RepID=UPI001CCD57BE|nr:hypothetical protein [Bremerella volcania]UBM37377.1 hypothetical protein LA756_05660 [Bremerella volcania]
MKLVEDFWKSKEFKKDSPPQEEYVRISWAFREHLINQAVRVATEVNQRVKEYHKAKIDPAAPAKGEKRDDQFYFPSPQEKSQALQRGEQEAVDTASNVLEIMGRKKLPNLPLSWAVLPDKSVFHGKEVVIITQVVDRQNALAKKVTPSGGEVFFWLAGVPFDNVADGATVEMSGVFLVDGTETYNTPRGTNTVKVLRRMPIDASKFYELSEFDKKD